MLNMRQNNQDLSRSDYLSMSDSPDYIVTMFKKEDAHNNGWQIMKI
jgi:hypothetical protein